MVYNYSDLLDSGKDHSIPHTIYQTIIKQKNGDMCEAIRNTVVTS